MPNDIQTEDPRSGKSNPYHLIYNILRYAQKHKYPAQRSALTYWEDKIPSRIDLGKSKYGGPFTAEEVENTKTFFQLIKLLLSLSGVLYTLNLIDTSLGSSSLHFSHGVSESARLHLIEILCNTVTISVLIVFYFILPYVGRYLPSMLKRVGIGALFATICTLSLLLIDSIGHATNINVPCFLFQSNITLNLSPYLNIIPHTLYDLSYMILTISLIEFIIAQSPHSMKGVLIGFYYVLRFGFSGIFILIEYFAFEKYPAYSNSLSSGTVYYIVTLIIALLSMVAYILISRKYKLREREEVINFHIFAEKYYES
jgi:peptide/histidine transporter 3/4